MEKEITILIDDDAIPKGWEPEKIGTPKIGDTIARYDHLGNASAKMVDSNWYMTEMIIRKKYDPGITGIPKGWWVWDDVDAWVASPTVQEYDLTTCVYGLNWIDGFIPPPDGQPRQIT